MQGMLFSAEEHRLLDLGEEDLRVLGKIIVESRRTRLGGADYKEIRHLIEIRQAPSTSFSGRRYAARLAPAGSRWLPGRVQLQQRRPERPWTLPLISIP